MHVLITLASWLVAIAFLRLGGVMVTRVGPVSIFFLFSFIYTGLAQLIVSAWIDGFVPGIPLDAILWSTQYTSEIVVYLSAFIVAYAAGVFFAKLVAMVHSTRVVRQKAQAAFTKIGTDESLYVPVLAALLLVAGLAAALFFWRFGIPIAQPDPDAARYAALEQGGYSFLLPAYFYLNPLVAAISMTIALRRDQLVTTRTLCLALLGLSSMLQLSSAFAGFRAFLITYIVTLVSVYCLSRRVSTKGLFLTMLSCAVGIFAVTWLKYSAVDDAGIVIAAKILNRVVLDSYFTLRIIFSVFDEVEPLLGLSYYWDLYSKMPGEQLSFQGFLTSSWISNSEFNIALAPTLAGEMFANFLWFGIAAAFCFGAVLRLSEMWFDRQRSTGRVIPIPMIGAYCVLTIVAERSVTVGLGGVFFLAIVVSVVILCMWLCVALLGAAAAYSIRD